MWLIYNEQMVTSLIFYERHTEMEYFEQQLILKVTLTIITHILNLSSKRNYGRGISKNLEIILLNIYFYL